MLKVVPIEERNYWDAVVRSFSKYDVYWLSGYVKAFQIHGDGEPMLFYYEGDNVRGINAVMKRDIAEDPHFKGKLEHGIYFDFATPYGYGGWLIEGDGNKDELFREYEEWCRNHGIVSEFVRFELFGDYRIHYDGLVETRSHNVICNLERPLDEVWMDFKQKVRKNVKRANGCGLKILIENSGEHLRDFLNIYYSTMDRNNAESAYYFSENFFNTLNNMNGNMMYFYVLYEDKVISTELVIYGSENCYSFLGGTIREYFALRPNDFLKYEIIIWARKNGLKNFVLGGGYGSDDGIFQYKACFAPNGIVDFYIGKKIIDKAKYDELLSIRNERPSSSFFPQYRA